MQIIATQTPQEALKPNGWIYDNSPEYKLVDVMEYDPMTKINWVVDVVEDKSLYKVDGDKFQRPYIKSGFCRKCQKEIKSYKEKFYKKRFEECSWNSWLYSANNGYCRECAIEEATKVESVEHPLFVTNKVHYNGGATGVHEYDAIEYSDGSLVYSDTREPKKTEAKKEGVKNDRLKQRCCNGTFNL